MSGRRGPAAGCTYILEPGVQWRRGGDPGGGLFSAPTPSGSVSEESRSKGPPKLIDAVLTGLPVPETLNGKGGSCTHS